jgi:hypothetical protein
MQAIDPDHGSIGSHTSYRWVDTISAAIFFTSTLCLVLAALYDYWSAFLWVLILIGVTILLYERANWNRRRSSFHQQVSFHIPYQDRAVFLNHFLPYMHHIGLEIQMVTEERYYFIPASQTLIHIGRLSFPPKAWLHLEMQVFEQKAVITGPRLALTTLKDMLQARAAQSPAIAFPIEIEMTEPPPNSAVQRMG